MGNAPERHKRKNKNTQTLIKMGILAILLFVFGSCNSLPLHNRKMEVYSIFNKLTYPYTTMERYTMEPPIGKVLSDGELETLNYWKKTKPQIKSLLIAECVGCSDQIEQLQPVYKVEKGAYTHFGFKDGFGIQNWVYKKNNGMIHRFYTFQGDTQKELTEQPLANLGKYQNLEGIYPIRINRRNMHLKHIIYNYSNNNDGRLHQTVFPTEIEYEVDLKNKVPVKFKFNAGFYSYQGTLENERHSIINFVDAFFYPIVINGGESKYYESLTDGYYANASFFQFSLQEDAQISIEIESNVKSKKFYFSVSKNQIHYTIDEYLKKKSEQFTNYQKRLKKGDYLIRVIHESADYMETPLYSVKISKWKIN